MDENQPTEPLYPQQQGVPPQQPPAHPYAPPAQPYGVPAHPVGEPFYKRHGLAFAISTLVLGVIVLFGIAGLGAFAVGSVVFHGGSSVSRMLHDGYGGPMPMKPGAPGQNGKGNGSGQGGRQDEGPIAKGVVRGTVTTISGSTWTITTQRGARLTVETSSSTVYGAPGQTRKASDFAVGDEVIVVGTRSGSTVTALRILNVADLPLRPGPSTPTPAPSS